MNEINMKLPGESDKKSADQNVDATQDEKYLAKVIKPFTAFGDSLKS